MITTITVPDEEVGGGGMLAFLSSTLYNSLPGIALALDEGLASTDDTYSLFYGERLPWWVDVTAHGKTGHGSRFIDETAGEKVRTRINRFRVVLLTTLGGRFFSFKSNKSSGYQIEHLLSEKVNAICSMEVTMQITLTVDTLLQQKGRRCWTSSRKVGR